MPTQYEYWTTEHWRDFVAAFPSDPEFSSLAPAVFAAVADLDVRCIVVENDYVDADYSAAYSLFYSHVFRPPAKLCKRYLFFSQLFTALDDVPTSELQAAFRGSLVIWPTTPPVIGRSLLPYPGKSDGQYRADAQYRVHINGRELTIETALFASKDHAVSACATIATWLATNILHARFGSRTASSAELTLSATALEPKWSRPIPQKYGLDPGQITRALLALDYGPHIYYLGEDVRSDGYNWIGLTYGYVCSGIPVILLGEVIGLGRHALLAVGVRTEDRDLEASPSGSLGTRSFARDVSTVIVHDDRFGPFTELVPDAPATCLSEAQYAVGSAQSFLVDALIVPLPSHVILLSQDAHALGVRHIQSLFAKVIDEPEYLGPFRTLLVRSIDLKEQSLTWPAQQQNVARQIRDLPLPQWVWVTEAYSPDSTSPRTSQPIARAIYDSTQLHFTRDGLFLAGHVGGAFVPDLD
jgi:hypothetical protein